LFNVVIIAFLGKELILGLNVREGGVVKWGQRGSVSSMGFSFLSGQSFDVIGEPRGKPGLLGNDLRHKVNNTEMKSII